MKKDDGGTDPGKVATGLVVFEGMGLMVGGMLYEATPVVVLGAAVLAAGIVYAAAGGGGGPVSTLRKSKT